METNPVQASFSPLLISHNSLLNGSIYVSVLGYCVHLTLCHIIFSSVLPPLADGAARPPIGQ